MISYRVRRLHAPGDAARRYHLFDRADQLLLVADQGSAWLPAAKLPRVIPAASTRSRTGMTGSVTSGVAASGSAATSKPTAQGPSRSRRAGLEVTIGGEPSGGKSTRLRNLQNQEHGEYSLAGPTVG